MKRAVVCLSMLMLVSLVFAAEGDSWKGEVVDLSCYISNGAKGPDHAACAKTCAKGGKPIGILTDDGKLMLLNPGKNAEAFEALKGLAGEKAVVKGTLAEKDGMKMITVSEAKAAS